MKHKGLLVILSVITVSVCSTVLVLKTRRNNENVSPRNDVQSSRTTASTVSAPLDLPRLTNQAAVIVVGKVLDLSVAPQQESQLGESYLATIHVNRTLKGTVDKPNISVKLIKTPDRISLAKSMTPSLYALFFLNQESPKGFSLTDKDVQAVVASEGSSISSRSVLDRVVNEVAHVLVSPNNSTQDQLQAVAALSSVDSPAANEALHQAVASKDVNVKLEAEVGLLKHNDLSVLDQVERTLMKSRPDISDNGVLRLSSGIRDGVRDPKAVPILGRLLSSSNPRVRLAAAHALRETRSDAGIRPLSAALNDSDQMVRYDAVLGLSEITGDLTHAPSVDLFKRDENKYLTYWRERAR